MKKLLSALLAVSLLVGCFPLALSTTASAESLTNLIQNGNLSNCDSTAGTAQGFNITAGTSGSGSATALKAIDTTVKSPAGSNTVRFNIAGTSAANSASGSITTTSPYTLKKNRYYELSVWVKTDNMYGTTLSIFEPTYIKIDKTTATTTSSLEGQNIYTYSYVGKDANGNPTTRVIRTHILYAYTANGLPVDGGSAASSMCIMRSNNVNVDASDTYDPSNAHDGWVQFKMTFKTDDTVDPVYGVTDSAPVSFCLSTRSQSSGQTGTMWVSDFSLTEQAVVQIESQNNGGSVSASPSMCGDGTPVTLSASPYEGNTFLGWYTGDTLVSASPVCTTPFNSSNKYTARFTVGNIIVDPGFEGYLTDTGTNYLGITDSTSEWKSPTMTATGSWMAIRGTTAFKNSGTKSLAIFTRNNSIYRDISGLTPHTDYTLSFNWYMPNPYNDTNLNELRAVCVTDSSETLASVSAKPTYLANDASLHSTGTWKKETLIFNSGNLSTVRLLMLYWSMEMSGTFYMDDLSVYQTQLGKVTINAKESAAVLPIGASPLGAPLGSTYNFKVLSLDTTPVVTANGTELTPDISGIYSFMVNSDTEIKVVCDGDELLPAGGKDALGNDLTKYNKDIYLKPIWQGDTIYQEPALFYTGRQTVKLLYPVDKIVSLRSYSLGTYYIQGIDYTIENGLIKILPGSRIPIYTGGLTRTGTTDPTNANYGLDHAFRTNEAGTETLSFIGDTVYPATAISVTYTHATTWNSGEGYTPYVQQSQVSKLQKTIDKLKNGQEVNIVIYGDSISCGWSSSGLNNAQIYDNTNTEGHFAQGLTLNVAPYAPTWIDQVLNNLRESYPNATINLKNLSLGGQSSPWGAANIAARLALWNKTPDLILIGFGVNDITGGLSADAFKTNMQAIVTNARTASKNSNLEALFYSPMLPNTKALCFNEQNMLVYETKLGEIAQADSKVGLVRLTSAYSKIIDSKEAVDYLNTNCNHGNDFTARMYAQGILAAMEPVVTTYKPGDINGDDAVDLLDITALSRSIAGWSVTVIPEALDTNGDGSVDLLDVTLLSRYVAGWNVTLSSPPRSIYY